MDLNNKLDNKRDNKDSFSIVKRAKSFSHAGRGIVVFLKSTHNAWIHIVVFLVTIVAGIYFNIRQSEWLAVILVSGLVLTAEAFNTAIEIDIDLTSPEYHPYAKDTKDVAAGAVLITAITAVCVGLLIFGPKIISLF